MWDRFEDCKQHSIVAFISKQEFRECTYGKRDGYVIEYKAMTRIWSTNVEWYSGFEISDPIESGCRAKAGAIRILQKSLTWKNTRNLDFQVRWFQRVSWMEIICLMLDVRRDGMGLSSSRLFKFSIDGTMFVEELTDWFMEIKEERLDDLRKCI